MAEKAAHSGTLQAQIHSGHNILEMLHLFGFGRPGPGNDKSAIYAIRELIAGVAHRVHNGMVALG
jgi:hypothetical protein